MHERWNLLLEFVAHVCEEPLSPGGLGQTPSLALAEWEALTKGRYDRNKGFVFVDTLDVDWIDPEIDPRPRAQEGTSHFPSSWFRIATDGSGHAYYFVDSAATAEDPPLWHWDEECSGGPPKVLFPHLSLFLTSLVVEATLSGNCPLGSLRSEVHCFDLQEQPPSLKEQASELEFEPWIKLGDLEVERTRDQSALLATQRWLWTLSAERSAPYDQLVRAHEERVEEEALAARAQAVKALDSPEFNGSGLLAELDALSDELTRLELMFLRDFRMQVVAKSPTAHKLCKKAASIVAKHQG